MALFGNLFNNMFGGSPQIFPGSSNPPQTYGSIFPGYVPPQPSNPPQTGLNSQNSNALDPITGMGTLPPINQTPTATFSSEDAVNEATGQITSSMNEGFDYLNQGYQYGQEQDQLQNQQITPPQVQDQEQPTPEDLVLHEGQTQYYNLTNGQPQWMTTPVDGTTPQGYSTQNPMTRTDIVSTIDAPGGITFKQFSDGTYGRFDMNTGGYTQSNSADFQIAQQYQDANKRLEDLKRGILTPDQQALLDGVKAQWSSLIDQQETMNKNVTGVQTGWQNLLGMGNNPIGQGAITKTIIDGTRRVAELQAKEAMALAQMKQSFQTDDINLLKSAYDIYTTAQKGVQETLNMMQQKLLQQQKSQEDRYMSYALQQSAKYGDAGILPSDRPWEVDEKKKNFSSIYQNELRTKGGVVDQSVLTGLLREYNKSGKIPTYAITRAGPQYMLAFWSQLGGHKDLVDSAAANAAAMKAANSALLNQEKQYNAEKKNATTLQPSIDRLRQYMQPLIDSGSPILNKPLRDFQGKVLGNETYTAYLAELNNIANEYSKILSGASASIAGVSVSSVDDIKKFLAEDATIGQMEVAIDAIEQDVQNRLYAGESQINEIKNSIYEIGRNSLETELGSVPPDSFSGSAWD